MKGLGNRHAWLLAGMLAWAWAWKHLSIEWTTNEQYQYALGVPPLAFYLAWRQWRGPFAPGRPGWLCLASVILGVAAFALGELLRWHDPIWRMTGGLLAAGATLVTAAGFYRIGGTPLLRRETFPILFTWAAVPWPLPCEFFLTQNLLRYVTTVTAGVLELMGIGVLQHGNAIELTGGILGIDDACSGIRSLQASLMATLFLGEYFRLSRGRRLGLVAGGILCALVLNCARVLGLALLLHAQGSDVAARFHDAAGDAATVATFVGLLGLALLLGRGRLSDADGAGRSELVPGFDGAAVCGAIVAIPLLSWGWFAWMGATRLPDDQRPQWTLSYSRLTPVWQVEPVEPTPGERTGLLFGTWQECQLRTPEGWNARIIHVGWNPGTSMPSLAFYHTPELCMPSIGWTEVGRPEKIIVPS
jgi:exosortase